jgi:hypothetical protein
VKNPTAQQIVVDLMRRHVVIDRVDLNLAVRLSTAEATPIARLGISYLDRRQIQTPEELDLVAGLSAARCAAVGQELTRWALDRLGTRQTYNADRIARFFDSLLREIREAAWDWLTPESTGYNDALLWSRLLETPYDDVRMRFVTALEVRGAAPGVSADMLSHLWSSVLLGIHRGGRKKLTALRQISRAVSEDPAHAEVLLPVLAVAIRSVRPPEARAGLAAVVTVVEARPELAQRVTSFLPELQLHPEGVA